MERVRRRYGMWFTWLAVVLGAYYASLYVLVGSVRLAGAINPQLQLDSVAQLWLRVAAGIVMLGFVLLAARLMRPRGFNLKVVGVARWFDWRDVGLALAGIVVYMLLTMIALGAARLLPFFDPSQAQALGETTLFGVKRLWAFVALVICVPLLEELVFRGVLYSKLRSLHMPVWMAAVAVSVLFGVAHGQWNVGIDVFCLSIVACYLREVTGGIWASVMLHMIKNAIAFVFVYMLPHL